MAAINAVLLHSKLRNAARLVVVVLAHHADGAGVSWPGPALIVAETKVSERTVKRSIAAAVKARELEVRQAVRARSRHEVFRLLLPDLDDVDYGRLPFTLDKPFAGQIVQPRGHLRLIAPDKLSGPARARSSSGTSSSSERSTKQQRTRGGLTDDRFSAYDR